MTTNSRGFISLNGSKREVGISLFFCFKTMYGHVFRKSLQNASLLEFTIERRKLCLKEFECN